MDVVVGSDGGLFGRGGRLRLGRLLGELLLLIGWIVADVVLGLVVGLSEVRIVRLEVLLPLDLFHRLRFGSPVSPFARSSLGSLLLLCRLSWNLPLKHDTAHHDPSSLRGLTER